MSDQQEEQTAIPMGDPTSRRREQPREVAGGQLKILCIDDDTDDAACLSDAIARTTAYADAHFYELVDPRLAPVTMANSTFDLVMLDYRFPGGQTGLSVLHVIRALGHEIPIIMMTSHGDEQLAAEATRAGADAYLPKSCVIDNLELLEHTISVAMTQSGLRHLSHALDPERPRGGRRTVTCEQLITCILADPCLLVHRDGTVIEHRPQGWIHEPIAVSSLIGLSVEAAIEGPAEMRGLLRTALDRVIRTRTRAWVPVATDSPERNTRSFTHAEVVAVDSERAVVVLRDLSRALSESE